MCRSECKVKLQIKLHKHFVEVLFAIFAMAKDAKAPEQPAVFALSDLNVELLGKHGIHIVAIEPLGAEVHGLDLRKKPNDEVLKALEARRI